MKVYHTTALPNFENAVITIGTFDGVHKGHQVIINTIIEEAKKINGTSIVVSFHPHPRTVVNPNSLLQVLNTPYEKKLIFSRYAIDHLIIYPFTIDFSNWSAMDYIEKFIIEKFNPKTIVIGFDHHFGKDRTGNIELLKKVAQQKGINLIEIAAQTIEQNKISSTQIRNALLHGEIEKANDLLGYAYPLSGIVVRGKQIGRTIGFKTANLQLDDTYKLIPGNGVYVVDVMLDNLTLQGMMNIGTRPTVDGSNRTIEVHILNFDADIYDQRLSVSIRKRLRNEQKFDGLESLKAQLGIDKKNTTLFFEVK
jgi:riboflavin kinase / FMN adenylyltransferase